MSLAKQRLVIVGVILVGILIIGFFGVRAAHAFRHIRDGGFGPGHPHPPPSETDVELIRDWMTVPYIANTYGVPDRMLFKELEIPDKENREKSLKELNDEFFPDKDSYVLDAVKKVITDHRPPAPAPTTIP